MIHLGLIGFPVNHSLSPQIHAAALSHFGLPGEYSLFPIPHDDENVLKDTLDQVRSGELHGLNITIPHKENVIKFLDGLTHSAELVGAVNTIYREGDRLLGDNTDVMGFTKDLKKLLDHHLSPAGREGSRMATVLGAGGGARAVAYSLLHDGWTVTIAARRRQQADHLASSFPGFPIRAKMLDELTFSAVDLLVNTTPLGMTPDVDRTPLPENMQLSKNTLVYDLVYNPRETKLVREARGMGLNARSGLGMLIEQAALGFEIWTGHKPPREILSAAVSEGSRRDRRGKFLEKI